MTRVLLGFGLAALGISFTLWGRLVVLRAAGLGLLACVATLIVIARRSPERPDRADLGFGTQVLRLDAVLRATGGFLFAGSAFVAAVRAHVMSERLAYLGLAVAALFVGWGFWRLRRPDPPRRNDSR